MKPKSLVRKSARAGSFDTSYVEAGELGAMKIMMLHDGAYGATAELCWSALIAELEDEFHIFAPDLLGWGQTDKAVFLDRSPYAGRLRHLEDFLEAADIDEALYVGCSFGGSLTIRAALSQGNPLRMLGGFSIAGTGGPYRTAEGLEALGAYKPTEEGSLILAQLLVEDPVAQQEQAEGRLFESLRAGHWEVMASPRLKSPDFPRDIPADALFDDLAKLRLPIQLVECRRDKLMEEGWSEKMAALSGQISVEYLDAGHLANIDNPSDVARLVRKFAQAVRRVK